MKIREFSNVNVASSTVSQIRKKAMLSFNFSIVMLVVTFARHARTAECPESFRPKTRTFSTLVSYQGNKIAFDPRNSSRGNYVSFSFEKIENLQKNTFISFDSKHIINLDLKGKSIEKMDDGAFISLTCLKFLTLKNNSLTEITWKTFDELNNLRELDLSHNKLRELPDLAFGIMEKLLVLDLSNNFLRKLSLFTFANLTNLRTLNMKSNKIFYIESMILAPLQNLKVLDLNLNMLLDDQFDKWTLTSLEELNLAGNRMRSFDTTSNYSFFGLKQLNLSSNYLTEFNVHGLKRNFHKLLVIDLNSNYFRCDNLAHLLHYLIDSRISLPGRNKTEINISGIDCENKTEGFIDFPESTTIVSTSLKPTVLVINKNNSTKDVKFVNQIQTLSTKNEEILLEISGVRKLLIFCLLFFVLFVIVYASFQVGLCDGFMKTCYRRDAYLNTTVQENYSMLRP